MPRLSTSCMFGTIYFFLFSELLFLDAEYVSHMLWPGTQCILSFMRICFALVCLFIVHNPQFCVCTSKPIVLRQNQQRIKTYRISSHNKPVVNPHTSPLQCQYHTLQAFRDSFRNCKIGIQINQAFTKAPSCPFCLTSD